MVVDYSEFYRQTQKSIPKSGIIKPTTVWTAVLLHQKLPQGPKTEEDYLWVKCAAKTTVNQIKNVYKTKTDESIDLAHEGRLLLADLNVQMKDLDTRGDRLVVFEAIRVDDRDARVQNMKQPLRESSAQLVLSPRKSLQKGSTTPSTPGLNPTPNSPRDMAYPRGVRWVPNLRDENDSTLSTPTSKQARPPPSPLPNVPPSSSTNASENSHMAPTPSAPLTSGDQQSPKSPAVSLEVHLKAFTSLDPPKNLPFLKFRRMFLENDPSARHYSPAYVHDMAWSLWESKSEKEKREYYSMARTEVNVSGKPTSWYDEAFQDVKPKGPSQDSEPEADIKIKPELDFESQFGHPEAESQQDLETSQPQKYFKLQDLLVDANIDTLERCVEEGVKYLDKLKAPVKHNVEDSREANQWVTQIEKLQASVVKTRTVIGVVGNTGAGKSSVINAMLDEERLVPTNTMRACTAVVTELSYNYEDDSYRAEVEFITAEDWRKEMKVLFDDLLNENGEVSRESSNQDSDAGVAYAKIKAVYPMMSKEDIANSNIDKLTKDVESFLGKTRNIRQDDSLTFYRSLQRYVDSKEKSTGKKDKNEKKGPKEREYWPLIKVVRLFVKAPALATGAVIVDLPGVHDANAARAAVAESYMKQCTGLWICAPIVRAVDDKAAKKLLGESFKRQLKMDGGFSAVTFICTKTDDISLMEASDSLGLNEQNGHLWDEMDKNERTIKSLKENISELQETKRTYAEAVQECDDELDVWEELRNDFEDGKTVFAPSTSKKRKRSSPVSPERKKKRARKQFIDSDDDFIVDDDDDEDSQPISNGFEDEDELSDNPRDVLTEDQISEKIRELKATKKEARRQRLDIEDQLKGIRKQIREANQATDDINSKISRNCIEGRNQYSKGAIQQDFASGIKEIDQEIAAEEDEENFDPEEDARDYDEVARSLPVFCVSSRGYQKLKGRLQRDANVPGFTDIEQTEVPALQAHCKQLTVSGRTAACKRFMTTLSQLLNSLTLWANNDGTGSNMTPEQRRKEANFLQKSLEKLESCFDKLADTTRKEIAEELGSNIFDKFPAAIDAARDESAKTCQHWGAPVNRINSAAGGFYWATFKALCRRQGVFSNANGQHDLNAQLTEPIMRAIASGWEKMFTRKAQAVLTQFSRSASNLLRTFHRDVSARAEMTGAGIGGLFMLESQLSNYEEVFTNVSGSIRELINKSQRDINREFTPVIKSQMTDGYQVCAEERGAGSFSRMKGHMGRHVDSKKISMFQQSCDQVKQLLMDLLRSVRDTIETTSDDVFLSISRDYRSVLGGDDVKVGEAMPKWQREMRREVMRVIGTAEDVFSNAICPKSENEPQVEDCDAAVDDTAEAGNKDLTTDGVHNKGEPTDNLDKLSNTGASTEGSGSHSIGTFEDWPDSPKDWPDSPTKKADDESDLSED